jgi:hypothetical protein
LSADGSARTYSCRGAFRSFGVLLVCKILASLVVGEEYRNVLIPELSRSKGINALLDLNPIGVDAKCRRILSSHYDCSFVYLRGLSQIVGGSFLYLYAARYPPADISFSKSTRHANAMRTARAR